MAVPNGAHRLEFTVYSYFEKGCQKNVHATIPKGNMGYDQYAVPDTAAVESSIAAFLSSHAILSNFFEEQWTQNHPQYLLGLSRALFPATFLEIAVYIKKLATSNI